MFISLNFKKSTLYLLALVISGCANFGSSSNIFNNSQNNSVCPEKPIATLAKNNVKEIILQEQKITQSGQVSVSRNVGYKFKAKQGQKLNYGTNDDICIWVFTPDNNILNSTELSKSGTYIIQVAAPRGSKTFDLDLSFGSSKPSSTIQVNSNQTNESNQSVTRNRRKRSQPILDPTKLSQDQAVEIVSNWYDAKSRIFGNPFDKSLVEKYTTGKLNQDTLKPNGSMEWLRSNGCYYTYNISNIEKVIDFSNTVQRPSLTVRVYEELQLHGPRKVGCGNKPQSYRANVTYWFEKDNGDWKIYHYKVNK